MPCPACFASRQGLDQIYKNAYMLYVIDPTYNIYVGKGKRLWLSKNAARLLSFIKDASLFFRFRTWSKEHAYGRTFKTKGMTQLILQVALVREVQRLWVIDEKGKGGWVHSRLRRIVDL